MVASSTHTTRTPLSPRSLNTRRTPPSAGFWTTNSPISFKPNLFSSFTPSALQIQPLMPPSPPTTPPSLQAPTRTPFSQRPIQPNPLIPSRADAESGNESSSSRDQATRELRRRERASRFLRGVRERREGSRWSTRSEQIMRQDHLSEQTAREAALAAAAPSTEWFDGEDSADDLMVGGSGGTTDLSSPHDAIAQPMHAGNITSNLTEEEEAAAMMELREQQELDALVDMMAAETGRESDMFDADADDDDDAIYAAIWAAESHSAQASPMHGAAATAPARVIASAYTTADADALAPVIDPDDMDVSN